MSKRRTPWAGWMVPASSLAFAMAAACAEGGEGGSEASTGAVDWSTSASGGAGGAAGESGAGASGGAIVSSSGGSGGSSSSQGGGGAGSGGGGSGTLVLVATGESQAFGASYQAGQSWQSAALLGGGSSHAPAAAFSAGNAIALVRAPAGTLRFTVWSGGTFSAFSDVGPGVTTRAAPAIAAGHALFHGEDFKHYYAAYAGSWSPIAEPVAPPAQPQSFGPEPPRVALLGGDVVATFAGDDGQLYVQLRTGGSWQPAQPVAGSMVQQAAAIAALDAGPELMVVYAHHQPSQADDKKLFWATRSAGLWSSPQKISDAVFTDDPVSLAALTGGEALVGYRGTDGMPYTLRYTPSNDPPWGAALPVSNPNPAVPSPPSVAPGIEGHDAELALVNAGDGSAYHARLSGGSWSAPTVVGGTLLHSVAIAAAP